MKIEVSAGSTIGMKEIVKNVLRVLHNGLRLGFKELAVIILVFGRGRKNITYDSALPMDGVHHERLDKAKGEGASARPNRHDFEI